VSTLQWLYLTPCSHAVRQWRAVLLCGVVRRASATAAVNRDLLTCRPGPAFSQASRWLRGVASWLAASTGQTASVHPSGVIFHGSTWHWQWRPLTSQSVSQSVSTTDKLYPYQVTPRMKQGHREFPFGNSREFPGIRHPKNSRREFPGITEFSVRVSGNL